MYGPFTKETAGTYNRHLANPLLWKLAFVPVTNIMAQDCALSKIQVTYAKNTQNTVQQVHQKIPRLGLQDFFARDDK